MMAAAFVVVAEPKIVGSASIAFVELVVERPCFASRISFGTIHAGPLVDCRDVDVGSER